MLRAKDVLIVFGIVLFWQSINCQGNELSSFFESLDKEVLSINHQTAEHAWDTK